MPFPIPAPHLKFMKHSHFACNVFVAQSSRRSRDRRRISGLIDINQNGANDEHQNKKLHVSAVPGHTRNLTTEVENVFFDAFKRLLVMNVILLSL